MKKATKFPDGWDDERVQRLLQHYKSQTEDEAVAEDEAVLKDTTQTLMEIPNALVPSVRAPYFATRQVNNLHGENISTSLVDLGNYQNRQIPFTPFVWTHCIFEETP